MFEQSSHGLGNGIAIAWWRQTLKGATVQQLQQSWSFSTSIVQVATAGKRFNVIALAAITTKLLILDSVLIQRSTSTIVRPDKPVLSTNITGFANQTIPVTGQITGRSGDIGYLESYFAQDLKIWSQSGGLLPNNYDGCDGLCFLQVAAAGFAFDCSEPNVTVNDVGKSTMQAAQWVTDHGCSNPGPLPEDPANCSSTEAQKWYAAILDPIFALTFTGVEDMGDLGVSSGFNAYTNTSYVQMDVAYIAAQDDSVNYSCPGKMTTQTCKLLPAVVNYPIQIQNYDSAHAVPNVQVGITEATYLADTAFHTGDFNATLKQQNGYEILSYRHISEGIFTFSPSYPNSAIGAIASALNSYLNASASIQFIGDPGWFSHQEGTALQWLQKPPAAGAGCDSTYLNPLANNSAISVPSVIQRINEIMFALATDMSGMDPSNDRTATSAYNATVYRDKIHYVSHFAYMWGAFASTLVCAICVLPVYWGFWELGRKVTLGPFEVKP